jgi:hypothetical protein
MWRGLFDVIEQIVEHHMFRHQDLRDFHGCNRVIFVRLPKSHRRRWRTTPFLAFFLPQARRREQFPCPFVIGAKRALEL